jgi:hypothetical protein
MSVYLVEYFRINTPASSKLALIALNDTIMFADLLVFALKPVLGAFGVDVLLLLVTGQVNAYS